MPLPPNIECVSSDPANPRFRCTACQTRGMANYENHVRSAAHRNRVQAIITRQADEEQLLLGLEAQAPTETNIPDPHYREDSPFEPDSPPKEALCTPPSPLTYLRSLDPNDLLGAEGLHLPNDMDDPEGHIRFDMLRQALETLNNLDLEDDEGESDEEEEANNPHLARARAQEAMDWHPFKNKEQVAGLLIIGSPRHLLSRSQYLYIRSILRILHVKLPEWGTLRDLKTRLKGRLGISLSERSAPSGTPLFGLTVKDIISNELANPLVSPHLVFVPELPHDGWINRLSQSRKWRECYSPELRVQMVVSDGQHFYIYEPVELRTGQLAVPIFFFQSNNKLKAKCLPATIQSDISNLDHLRIVIPPDRPFDSDELYTFDLEDFVKGFQDISLDNGQYLKDFCGDNMYQQHDGGVVTQPLQNPWREKAGGKVIRHVPITLYSDDTSGNVSKKWNKHMSLYFTLSGLAPEWTNQEYNIHFLATSNSATALELLDEVVDDINDHGENGFIAYDEVLKEDVLVMVVVLCHLGDSPMHAEICNTTNPANTLTPCRMCELRVDKKIEKETARFVRDFVGVNAMGEKSSLEPRKWHVTLERTQELWNLAKKKNTKTHVEEKARTYGLRDPFNDYYVQKVHHALNILPQHEVESLCQRLNDEKGLKLFNPMLRLKGFDGHLDTPVEILHVVLLGIVKYLFRELMKRLLPMKPGSEKFNYISARWRAFSSRGLNTPPVQAINLIQYYQSLRREALRIFQKGRGSSSIWAAVDTQLDDLRHRGNDYTASFYNLIYEDDRSTFDGQARYEDISEVAEFRLPFEEEVNAAIIGQANNLE